MAPLDTGLLSEAEWGRRVGLHIERHTGRHYDLSRFRELWFADRTTNTPMVEYLRSLRNSGYRIGMLTNNVREWEPYWRAMLPVDEVFDIVVNSCEVGHRKPEPEMFAFATSAAGVAPHECLLVDDLDENCVAARNAGWLAVHFHSTEQAVADVSQMLSRAPLLEAQP